MFQLSAQQKPNIVFILSDDAGYADFGFMTDHLVPTPNIDEISKRGIKFTDAHVSAAVCCPSRAGLLTGINQAKFGHVYNYIQGVKYNIPSEEFGIPLTQKLIGDYLKPLGYKTAIIGKWHEGFARKFQPQNRGFDYAWGFLWGRSPYFSGQSKLVLEDGISVPADSIAYMTDAIGSKAIAFIEKNQKQPFFAYVSFNAPHTPMQAKPDVLAKLKGKFKSEGRALNAAMTYTLDENVGRIIAKLKELKLFDNTLIVFSNDNGGQTVESFADNFPLRGRKGDIYEGGVRVPMAMMWKGHIPEGIVCDKVVSTLDLLPTFLYAAQSSKPHPLLDGVSLLPVSELTKVEMDQRSIFWFLGHGVGAVRQGKWKLIVAPGKAPELYNLKIDIAEKHNLYTAGGKVALTLLKKYNTWKSQLPPPLWVPQNPENESN